MPGRTTGLRQNVIEYVLIIYAFGAFGAFDRSLTNTNANCLSIQYAIGDDKYQTKFNNEHW